MKSAYFCQNYKLIVIHKCKQTYLPICCTILPINMQTNVFNFAVKIDLILFSRFMQKFLGYHRKIIV